MMHEATFTFSEPQFGVIEIDLDPELSKEDKEDAVIREIRDVHGDEILDVKIEEIKII